ncbi:MAG: hypothetical protein JO023_26275 [Chloroflexi bacterium]|nr:hypothetical protein [Chloroflexota bacterium]
MVSAPISRDRASVRISALDRVEAWLEGARFEQVAGGGYGGPVVHWWRDSLLFCGPGFDWRYEGVITGYLELARRTGQPWALIRARRAGDDLVAAQLPGGNFANSAFELNPSPGGTPHEAAADIGLLALASELRAAGDPAWVGYANAARDNIERFYLQQLWDPTARRFRDSPGAAGFVPNKAATLVEALFRLADLEGDEHWQEAYARPTVDAILAHQLRRVGDRLDGAIAQASRGRTPSGSYFPYYVARCIPALVEAAHRFDDDRYLEAALAAGSFVKRWSAADGSFPQVVYASGRANRFPRWVAAVGDILRAWQLLLPAGFAADLDASHQWLMAGQLPCGGFMTARDFGGQVAQRRRDTLPDFRDLLPVAGWNDKAFRYLAQSPRSASAEPTVPADEPSELACLYQGRPATLRYSRNEIELRQGNRLVLGWRRGASWATRGETQGVVD